MFKKVLCFLISFLVFASCANGEQYLDDVLSRVRISDNQPDNPILLATVNGKEIYDNDYGYFSCLAYNQQKLSDYSIKEDSEDYGKYIDCFKRDALNEAIMHTFTEETVEKINSDGEVIVLDPKGREDIRNNAREYWESLIDQYINNNDAYEGADKKDEKIRSAAIADIEKQYSINEDIFVSSFLEDYDYYALTTALTEYWRKNKTFTDEEIKEFYNVLVEEDKTAFEQDVEAFEQALYQNMVVYYVPEGYRAVKQIAIPVDDFIMNNYTKLIEEYNTNYSAPREINEEDKQRGKDVLEYAKNVILNTEKDKLEEIKTKLDSGVPFDDLIMEYNEDPGMKDEKMRTTGYWVSKKSVIYDQRFIDVAMSLENIGDYSEPAIGDYGIFILYYYRDVPAGPVELTEDIKEAVVNELIMNENGQIFGDEFSKWKESADIQYTKAGQAILDNAVKAEEYFSNAQ